MVHRSSCEFRDHQESSSLVSEKRKHLAAWCSNAGIIYGNLDDGLHGDSKEFEDSSLKKDFEPGADSVLRFRAPKQGWVSGRGSLQPQEDTSRPGFVYRKAPFDESHAAKSKAETLRFLEVSAIAGDLTLASQGFGNLSVLEAFSMLGSGRCRLQYFGQGPVEHVHRV